MARESVRSLPVYQYCSYAGDYPVGAFELLATKQAELDVLQERVRQLQSDIKRLETHCHQELNYG